MNKLALVLGLAFVPFTATAEKNYMGGKGGTWDCAKDPVVNINHGSGKYTFKGACETINLNGGKHTMTIESVGTLNVNSGKNTITIGTVGTINVVGANNVITYKAAKGGDEVSTNVVGTGNKIGKAK